MYMTHEEYERKLQWYRDYIVRNENDKSRRGQEYLSYLKRWFGDGRCDGIANYQERYKRKTLPMPYNIYFS